MVDLTSRPRFLVGATIDPTVGLAIARVVGLTINGVMSLAIDRAILMGADVTVSFSGFSLW